MSVPLGESLIANNKGELERHGARAHRRAQSSCISTVGSDRGGEHGQDANS